MAKLFTRKYWTLQIAMLLLAGMNVWINNISDHRRLRLRDWEFFAFITVIILFDVISRWLVGDLPEDARAELRTSRMKRVGLPVVWIVIISIILMILRPSSIYSSYWLLFPVIGLLLFSLFSLLFDFSKYGHIGRLRKQGISGTRLGLYLGASLLLGTFVSTAYYFRIRNLHESHLARSLYDKAETNDPSALAALQHECDAGNAAGCFNLAFLYDLGLGNVQKNFGKAAPLYEKGCAGGSGQSCKYLAERYMVGRETGRDYAHAYALLETCHEKGDRGDCLAPVVEFMTEECGPHSPDQCLMLAWLYRTGKGVPVNEAKAAAISAPTLGRFEQECKNGKAWGCEELSSLFKFDGAVPADPAKVIEYHQLACKAGEKSDCL